jgi:hypothetical protein
LPEYAPEVSGAGTPVRQEVDLTIFEIMFGKQSEELKKAHDRIAKLYLKMEKLREEFELRKKDTDAFMNMVERWIDDQDKFRGVAAAGDKKIVPISGGWKPMTARKREAMLRDADQRTHKAMEIAKVQEAAFAAQAASVAAQEDGASTAPARENR